MDPIHVQLRSKTGYNIAYVNRACLVSASNGGIGFAHLPAALLHGKRPIAGCDAHPFSAQIQTHLIFRRRRERTAHR